MEVYFGSILHGNHTILLLLPETNQLTPEPNYDIRLHGFHLLIVIALFQLDWFISSACLYVLYNLN